MKSLYQLRNFRLFFAVGGKDIRQIFPKGKITERIVLGKNRISAGLEVAIPKIDGFSFK